MAKRTNSLKDSLFNAWSKMKTKWLFGIIVVLIASCSVVFFRSGNNKPIDESIGDSIQEVHVDAPSKVRQPSPVKENSSKPELSKVVSVQQETDEAIKQGIVEGTDEIKTSVKASDPLYAGIKERWSVLMEADEYYIGEYSDQKSKALNISPTLVKFPEAGVSWKLEFGASLCGQVVVKDSHLFFTTFDRQVFEVDATNGVLIKSGKLWAQPIGSPLWYEGDLIFPQRNGNFTRLELDEFKRVWNSRIAVSQVDNKIDISISGAVIRKDRIYVSKHWGNLYVLNAKDGMMLADPGVPYESRINTPAVFWGSSVLYGNVAGEILCFAQSGKGHALWKHELPEGYATAMKVVGDVLYLLSSEKVLHAFSLKDQQFIWSIPLDGFGFRSIATFGDSLVVQAGSLYRIELKSGRVEWKVEATGKRGFCRDEAVIEGSAVWALEQEGRLIEVNFESGEVINDRTISSKGEFWNGISLNENHLFCSSIQKELFAVQIQP